VALKGRFPTYIFVFISVIAERSLNFDQPEPSPTKHSPDELLDLTLKQVDASEVLQRKSLIASVILLPSAACFYKMWQHGISVSHAVNTDFTLLDETDDYIVVDKPAPLQVHPSTPNGTWTLWQGLKELLAYEMANGGQISIINRLDRETSGTVLVAKTQSAARRFGMAMQERQFRKIYLAIVHGWPEWEALEVNAPILRKGEVAESPIWVKQMVHPDGSACQTRFRLLKKVEHPVAGRLALVEAAPVTGRMHQLRVHLAHLGHPILGDKIYGEDECCYLDFIETGWTGDLKRRLHFSRQALHSHRLEVKAADFSLAWEAPLPGEMAAWVE
jgi:23S rRNA pseudouridine1911/1915/1917 synthase